MPTSTRKRKTKQRKSIHVLFAPKNLKQRETIHSRKAYSCETCNSSFQRKDHNNSHVATCSMFVEDAENTVMCSMNVQDTDNTDQMVPSMVEIYIEYNFVGDMKKENESQTTNESLK